MCRTLQVALTIVYCIWVTSLGPGFAWHALIDLEEYLNRTAVAASASNNTNDTSGGTPVAKPLAHVNITDPTTELLELNGTRYFILRKRISWPQAITLCQSYDLRLVSLPHLEDAKVLVEAIRKISQPYFKEYDNEIKKYEFGMDRRYWIGLTDMVVEGDWEWIAEGYSLRYSDMWYPAQPDHLRQTPTTSEHCASLWNPGYINGDTHSFNDEDCSTKYYAVCGKQPPFLEMLLRHREINQPQSPEKLEKIKNELKSKQAKTQSKRPKTTATTTQLPPCAADDSEDDCSGETTTTAKPKHKHSRKNKTSKSTNDSSTSALNR